MHVLILYDDKAKYFIFNGELVRLNLREIYIRLLGDEEGASYTFGL